MCKYQKDPKSSVEDTERTRFCPQTDRRIGGCTDGKSENSIPHFNFVEAGDIMKYKDSDISNIKSNIFKRWTNYKPPNATGQTVQCYKAFHYVIHFSKHLEARYWLRYTHHKQIKEKGFMGGAQFITVKTRDCINSNQQINKTTHHDSLTIQSFFQVTATHLNICVFKWNELASDQKCIIMKFDKPNGEQFGRPHWTKSITACRRGSHSKSHYSGKLPLAPFTNMV